MGICLDTGKKSCHGNKHTMHALHIFIEFLLVCEHLKIFILYELVDAYKGTLMLKHFNACVIHPYMILMQVQYTCVVKI